MTYVNTKKHIIAQIIDNIFFHGLFIKTKIHSLFIVHKVSVHLSNYIAVNQVKIIHLLCYFVACAIQKSTDCLQQNKRRRIKDIKAISGLNCFEHFLALNKLTKSNETPTFRVFF